MNVIAIEDAIEFIGFGGLPEHDRKLKQAVTGDGGKVIYFGNEDGDAWYDSGRWELAEEIVFAAIKAGKLRLLGAERGQHKENQHSDSRELLQVERHVIANGIFDRWDGEYVLLPNGSDDGERSDELNDLHFYADDLDDLAADLVAYRRADSSNHVEPVGVDGAHLQPKTVNGTASGETECVDWFLTRVQAMPDSGPGKEMLWQEAQQEFGERLSRRAYLRVWDRHAPHGWKTAGRKARRMARIAS